PKTCVQKTRARVLCELEGRRLAVGEENRRGEDPGETQQKVLLEPREVVETVHEQTGHPGERLSVLQGRRPGGVALQYGQRAGHEAGAIDQASAFKLFLVTLVHIGQIASLPVALGEAPAQVA